MRIFIWSAPPSSAFSAIRMCGGAFVVWCSAQEYSRELQFAENRVVGSKPA